MARISFSTSDWSAFFVTPNQLISHFSSRLQAIVALTDDVVSEELTPTGARQTLGNGGVVDFTGSGFESGIATITRFTYGDPDGNSADVSGNVQINLDGDDFAGTLTSVNVRLSGIEISAAGTIVFNSNGTGTSSLTGAVLKLDNWTFDYGGSASFNLQTGAVSGNFDHLTVTSPQADSFSISDATLPVPLLNSIAGQGMGFFLSESFLSGDDVLSAADENDVFSGFAGNDSLAGGGGNDTLAGGGGNDTVDGGSGIDLARFSANRAQYALARDGGDWSVSGPDGQDRLRNIERIEYGDQKLALDLTPDGNAGRALELLGVLAPQAIESPEIVGAGLFLFDIGLDMSAACQLLIDKGIVRALAGSDSDEALARMVFRNVVGQEASEATADALAGLMQDSGGPLSQAAFLAVAAGLELNQQQIDLIGLQQTGIEYL
jgi:Ca2+-binding RTX toxin-like protein